VGNLTLSIDDDVLRRARIRALESGTSVNAIVRDYLSDFAGSDRASRAIQGFVEIAERSTAGSGSGGRTWAREHLYEERVGHREHGR
jgi:plasmid stability protein